MWRNWLSKKLSPWVIYPLAILTVIGGYFAERMVLHIDTTLDATILVSITVLISLIFGMGPGLVAALLEGLIIDYMDREPIGQVLTTSADFLFLLFYIGPSLLTGVLISTLRNAFQELNDTTKEREEILSVVSHDLRSPLTAIILNAQRLGRIEKDAESLSIIKTMESAGQSMNELIQNLLDAAKMQRGKYAASKEKADVAALAKKVVDNLRPLAQAKKIELTLRSEESLTCEFDSSGMFQVFYNLIGNSLKFTAEGGQISVDVIKIPEGAKIVVSDTGCGIPENVLPKIFQRYWQGTREAKKGAGLGLYIVKSIVLAHGGSISVTSDVNKGTSFLITLKDCQ